MSSFYKVTDKELLEIRNNLFLKNGIQTLMKNGFEKSPFSTAWYGKNNLGSYTYELCRLSTDSHLEIITTHIAKGDRWVQIYLNIFQLRPEIKSLMELDGFDGLQFSLPPNNLSKMRLWIDDYKGIPLFNFNFSRYKIKTYCFEEGLQKEIERLSEVIKKDMTNIDSFIQKWHERHKPLITNWIGVAIIKQ